MEIDRGDVWWADLPEPVGSSPGYRRPVVVVQANYFNQSRLATIMVAACSSNLTLANLPGNMILPATQTGLPRNTVVNLTQVMTVDRSLLTDWVCRLPTTILRQIDDRLRFTLDLEADRSKRNGR